MFNFCSSIIIFQEFGFINQEISFIRVVFHHQDSQTKAVTLFHLIFMEKFLKIELSQYENEIFFNSTFQVL
ncbi:MAG: hypothetical protein LBQ24_04865 [Candidatus Peribacteria bacterium]|nr:hypothetical protein [Candidatus Peribacteria bacterium]